MESVFKKIEGGFRWEKNHQIVQVEAWGLDGVRVRATPLEAITELPGALLPNPAGSET